jgi:hypothetical protein
MKKFTLSIFVILSISGSYAQVGINADNSAPHSSAQLDVKSTTKAFYPPRMTTVQKNAIASPQAGAVVFDNTLNQLSFYNGSSWVAAAGSGLTLPYNQSASVFTGYDGGLFKVTNTLPTNSGEGVAINGSITGGDGWAIRAMATNTSPFLTAAIYATNAATNDKGYGIWGSHAGSGEGIYGSSGTGIGLRGSGGSHGVKGTATGTTSYGIFGESTGQYGAGVRAVSNVNTNTAISALATGAENSDAIYAFSNHGIGVEARSFNGIGLIASSTNSYALITAGGNVGLGVNEPTTILDIKSRMRIRHSTETAGVYFDGTTGNYKGFVGLESDNLTGIFGFNGAGWAVKMNNTTGEWMANGGLSVGGGSKIGKINRSSAAYDVPNINSNTYASFSIPVTDAQVGDQVLVTASGNLAPLVIGNCYVTIAGNVNLIIINNSNINVDPASMSYVFTIIR